MPTEIHMGRERQTGETETKTDRETERQTDRQQRQRQPTENLNSGENIILQGLQLSSVKTPVSQLILAKPVTKNNNENTELEGGGGGGE